MSYSERDTGGIDDTAGPSSESTSGSSGSSGSGLKQSDAKVLFKGDTGTLNIELRKVLNLLILGPFIDGRKVPKIWSSLIHGEDQITSQLNNMGLHLVLSHEHEIAFTKQVEDEDFKIPVLLRKYKLAFMDAVLLLHLRERVMLASAEGSRAVLTRKSILDHLVAFEKSSGDEVKSMKRRRACLERMVSIQILTPFGAGDEQYEVSPVLRMIFGAEEIEAMTQALARMLDDPEEPDSGSSEAETE